MRKSDAVSYFGNQQQMARKLGLSPSTICEMSDPLPLGWAEIVEKGSRRRVKVDYSLYPAASLPPLILENVVERAR